MRNWSFHIFLTSFLFACLMLGQTNYDLSKLESLAIILKAKGGDLFFPDKFSTINADIEKLHTYSPEYVQVDLEKEFERIEQDLSFWISQVEETQQFLINVMDIRQNALDINADMFAPELFTKGEKKLKEAAYHHQNQSLSHANYSAKEAKKHYQNAEISTIRNTLLGEIRILVKESADLGAKQYAPESYSQVKDLLFEVEKLLVDGGVNYHKVSRLSQELYKSAQQLNSIVKEVSPIYQTDGNAEAYILSLRNQIASLAEKLGYENLTEKNLQELINDLLIASQNFLDQKNRFEIRNQQLEFEKGELERELLSLKNLADQRLFLDRKIKRVKTILSGNVKEQGTYLILRLDSLAYTEKNHRITPQLSARLTKMIDALSEFPEHPYIVRYVQHSTDNVVQDQALANLRAFAIRDYIQSHLLFADNQIEALGLIYKDDDKAGNETVSQMEVLIDLKSYLTFDVSRPLLNAD